MTKKQICFNIPRKNHCFSSVHPDCSNKNIILEDLLKPSILVIAALFLDNCPCVVMSLSRPVLSQPLPFCPVYLPMQLNPFDGAVEEFPKPGAVARYVSTPPGRTV